MNITSKNISDFLPEEKRALLAKMLQSKNSGPTLYPLSHGQQALWFLHQLAPKSAAYNISFAIRITPDLDTAALQRAFQGLINRHPALRTTYMTRGGKPVQLVHRQQRLQFDEKDASAWSLDQVNQYLVDAAHRPFDLEQGPVLRLSLCTRSPEEHILLVTIHHIAHDFWSLVVLISELRVMYLAETVNLRANLPPLKYRYTDYVSWQSAMLASAAGEQHRTYWQKQLAGELQELNLPHDRPYPPELSYQGDSYVFTFDESITRRIKELARAEGATLYVTLLAAFQVLLYRYTQQEEILVGSPTFGRSKPEFESILGYFANTVVLRGNLSGRPSFKEFLAQLRHTVAEAFEHQDYPFSLTVERLQPPRSQHRSPLFQVMFVLEKSHRSEEQGVTYFVSGQPGAKLEFSGLRFEPFPLRQQVAQFDLELTMVEAGDSLAATLQYSTDLFDGATVRRLAGSFQRLLESIVTSPEQQVADLPILTEPERERLLFEWNDTHTDFPSEQLIHELFEAQVQRTPAAVAVISRGERLTYHQLNCDANRMARLLVEYGVGPGVVVPILTDRGSNLLIAMIAVFKAGGAYLPLDPFHPPERLRQVLDQSESRLVLVADNFAENIAKVLEGKIPGRRPQVLVIESLLQQEQSESNLTNDAVPNDLAYVIYTSGSTGAPKGAMIAHGGMLNHLYAKIAELQLTAADIVAQTASQCFDISVWQFLAPLLVGGRVCIFDDEVIRDPVRLLESVKQESISVLETVPSLLRVMMAEITRPESPRPVLSALRRLICTGEALPPELCRQWLSVYPSISLLNAYGPTECSDDVTHQSIDTPPTPDQIRIPVGRPIANMKIHVLDQTLALLPVGVVGELCVGGIGVGRGYQNDPMRTAESFIPDPFSQAGGRRLYRAGDLGRYLSDGSIEFLGRIDDQVKVRGFRIELGEIQSALLQHQQVQEVVVIARADTSGDNRLIAYLTAPSQVSAPTASQLRRYLQERLPDYMMPAAFVLIDKLPLTSNGKLNRQALPAPDQRRLELEQEYVTPRSLTEEVLVRMWSDVLEVQQIGIHDNFFTLGGDSLKMTQIVSRIRDCLQIELPLRRLFESPTIAELTMALVQHQAEQVNPEQLARLLDELERLSDEQILSNAAL